MLISRQLDDQSFDQIFQKAQKQISLLTSDWTNYNPSDPGITLLELLSWYKEVQQYHLNELGREHELAYLRLLGAAPRPVQPARALLLLTGEGEVPEGSVFWADDIPFETTAPFGAADARVLFLGRNGHALCDLRRMWDTGGKLEFTPFLRERSEERPCFNLYFDTPLPAGMPLQMWFQMEEDSALWENNDTFLPYVSVSGEFWNGREYLPFMILEDQTQGFFHSGLVRFQLPEGAGMEREESGYSLRFVLREGDYVKPPVIGNVWFNAVQTIQRETLSQVRRYRPDANGTIRLAKERLLQTERMEIYGVQDGRRIPLSWEAVDETRIRLTGEIPADVEAAVWQPKADGLRRLGTANGIADMRVPLLQNGVIPDSLVLMVKEPDGCWHTWERTENLDVSAADARVYRFDDDTGELVFGDDEHGMAPEGELRLLAWAVTRGGDGNIQNHSLTPPPDIPVHNAVCAMPAWGGCEAESVEDCFRRVRQELNTPKRCVTLEDFEKAALSVPGIGLKRVRAFIREGTQNHVYLAVELANGSSTLPPGVLENFRRAILPRAMVNTRVDVLMPVYVKIKIYAQIGVRPQASVHQREIRKIFVDYFEAPSIRFGATLSRNALLECLYALPQIDQVEELELSFSGGNAVMRGGDVLLGDACLPKLGNLELTILTRDR